MTEPEAKERDVSKSTLDEILDKIKQRLDKNNLSKRIRITNRRSFIGILTYKKNKETKTHRLYSVSMVVDGEDVDYIYAENGDNIARVIIEKSHYTVLQDKDIKLEEEKLISNIKITNENLFKMVTHNEKELSDDENPNISKYGIKPDSSAAIINLNTPYNGRRMIDYLGMDKKYNKLNYLGLVKSSELTSKDGKKRENEFVPVLMNDEKNPTNILEIGEEYLKYRPDLSKNEQINADRTSDIYGDGEQIKGARTTTNTGPIDVFEFPNAREISSDKSHVMTLHIRNKIDSIEKGVSPTDGNNIEVFIGRQYAGKTEHALKEGLDTHLTKLEATNEANRYQEFYSNIDRANDKGVRDVEEDVYSSYERLANRIINQCSEWDSIFDKETLIQRIQELHESPVIEVDDQMVFYEIVGEITVKNRGISIEKMNQIISNAINNAGLNEISERDANEINEIMKDEMKIISQNVKERQQTSSSIDSKITEVANDRAKYLDMAYKISKKSNTYGIRDVYDEIMKIKEENKEINDVSLFAQAKERLTNQRIKGDTVA